MPDPYELLRELGNELAGAERGAAGMERQLERTEQQLHDARLRIRELENLVVGLEAHIANLIADNVAMNPVLVAAQAWAEPQNPVGLLGAEWLLYDAVDEWENPDRAT